MTTSRQPNHKLPEHIHFKHGAYYYARWNPAEKKTVWKRLGSSYAEMLIGLAEFHDSDAFTMEHLLERYRKEVSSKQSANTRRQRNWQLNKLVESFGKMTPEAVTTKHVYRFMDEYGADAPVSANRIVSLLHRVMKKAIRWGYVDANPAAGLEKYQEKPRRRTPSEDEYETLLAALDGVHNRGFKLLRLGAQRVMDTLTLPWTAVKPSGEVHVTQSKTGTLVIIEPTPELTALIAECRAQSVLGRTVIADENGQTLTYWGFANHVRRVRDRLVAEGKLESFNLHDLRRTVGSEAEPDNEILGHLDERTRKRVYDTRPKRGTPTR